MDVLLGGGIALGAIIAIIVVLFIISGFRVVNQYERAVVDRKSV